MVLETVAVVASVLIAAEILVGLVMNYLYPNKDPNQKNTLLNSYVYEQPRPLIACMESVKIRSLFLYQKAYPLDWGPVSMGDVKFTLDLADMSVDFECLDGSLFGTVSLEVLELGDSEAVKRILE